MNYWEGQHYLDVPTYFTKKCRSQLTSMEDSIFGSGIKCLSEAIQLLIWSYVTLNAIRDVVTVLRNGK